MHTWPADGQKRRERHPTVSPHLLGKLGNSWLLCWLQLWLKNKKLPMVPFSLWNWVIATLGGKPSMHKSQETHDCHSHTPARLSTHRWPLSLLKRWTKSLPMCQATGKTILGICQPQRIKPREKLPLQPALLKLLKNIHLFLHQLFNKVSHNYWKVHKRSGRSPVNFYSTDTFWNQFSVKK